MNTSLLRLAAASAAFLLTASAASAQLSWEGSDNFNDASLTVGLSERWSVNLGTGGSFVETNGRMEFQGSQSSATPGFRTLGWNGGANVASTYTTPWVISADLALAHTSNGGLVQHGLEVRPVTTTAGLGNFYLTLFRDAGSTHLGAGYTLFDGTTAPFTQLATLDLTSEGTALTVSTRITWNPTTEEFEASYSFNSGASYTTLTTFDTSTIWTATPTNGFFTNLVARAALDENVASGGMSFDNFTVSAIPEPSAFAVLAGLATLGLATSRRRRRA